MKAAAVPPPAALGAASTLRDLLASALSPAFARVMALSILLKGVRGAGKRSLVRYLADELGFNLIEVRIDPEPMYRLQSRKGSLIFQIDCYEITSDTPATTTATIQARLAKARAATPSIVLLHHIEALSRKTDATTSGRQSAVVKTLQDALEYVRETGRETGWSTVLIGTTGEAGSVEDEVAAVFKQEVEIGVSLCNKDDPEPFAQPAN